MPRTSICLVKQPLYESIRGKLQRWRGSTGYDLSWKDRLGPPHPLKNIKRWSLEARATFPDGVWDAIWTRCRAIFPWVLHLLKHHKRGSRGGCCESRCWRARQAVIIGIYGLFNRLKSSSSSWSIWKLSVFVSRGYQLTACHIRLFFINFRFFIRQSEDCKTVQWMAYAVLKKVVKYKNAIGSWKPAFFRSPPGLYGRLKLIYLRSLLFTTLGGKWCLVLESHYRLFTNTW